MPAFSVQVKVALTWPFSDWPTPTPVAVQPATAIAASDAAAVLIDMERIVLLLSSFKTQNDMSRLPRLFNEQRALSARN